MGKKGLPERWLEYSSMGRRIAGTRFIPFKVPLKQTVLKNLSSTEDLFDTRAVMDRISDLGMVIDLTNTDRYYDAEDFKTNKISYNKLKTLGQLLPNDGVFKRFCYLVENFIENNKHNDKLIGVHCTHGLNRTGYMICRYMIQQLGVAPEQVISDFNSARGYNMERDIYLEDLRKADWPRVIIRKDRFFNKDGPRRSRWENRQDSPQWEGERSQFRGPYDHNQSWSNSPRSYDRGRPEPRFRDRSPLVLPPPPVHHLDEIPRNVNRERELFREREMLRERMHQREREFHREPYHNREDDREYERDYFRDDERDFQRERIPHSREESFHLEREFENFEKEIVPNPFSPPDFVPPERAIDMGPSLHAGKEYYQKFFGEGSTSHYDSDSFSRAGGGGLGPHRPPPRQIFPRNDGGAPRQYRGPRPHNMDNIRDEPKPLMPEQEEPQSVGDKPYFMWEGRDDTYGPPRRSLGEILNAATPTLRNVDGPGRSMFSPGARSRVFSPEGDMPRNRRFQPY